VSFHQRQHVALHALAPRRRRPAIRRLVILSIEDRGDDAVLLGVASAGPFSSGVDAACRSRRSMRGAYSP